MKPSLAITLPLIALAAIAGGCAEGTAMVDRMMPVTILSPREDARVAGMVQVQARIVIAASMLSTVQLRIDGEMVLTEVPARDVEFEIDVSGMRDGPHVLEVVALERDGTAAGTARRNVFVDNTGAALTIVEPSMSRVFIEDGPAPFVVAIGDSTARRVTLYVGDVPVAQESPPSGAEVAAEIPAEMLLGTADSVMVELAAQAEDSTGAITEATTWVTITRHERWVASEDAAVHAPLLIPGAVVLGTDDRLVVYDIHTGTQRCRVDGVVTSAPLLYVAEQNAVFWSTTDLVRSIDAGSCGVNGSRPSAGDVVTGMTRTGTGVALVTFAGQMVHVGPDLTEQWTADLAGAVTDGGTLEIDGAIGVAPDATIYVAGSLGPSRGGIFQVRGAGTVTYAPLPSAVSGGLLATADGAFVAASDGRMYRIAPDLTRPWRTAPVLSDGVPIRCTPVSVSESVVASCDGDTSVHALDVETGTVVWTYDASGGMTTPRILGRGGLVAAPGGGRFGLGDRLGNLHVIDSSGELLWTLRLGTSATSLTAPAMTDDTLAVADDAGALGLFGM